MVEIVLALGIVAFALLTLVALLPAGMKSNQVSTEETRAASLLTMLEADLRNTHPAANNGRSLLFGLALPYQTNTSSRVVANSALEVNKVSTNYSAGVQDDGTPVAYTAANRVARYQASVIYTSNAGAGDLSPTHARLIVNWPSFNATNPAQLTSLASVSGFVETYVTFPQP